MRSSIDAAVSGVRGSLGVEVTGVNEIFVAEVRGELTEGNGPLPLC